MLEKYIFKGHIKICALGLLICRVGPDFIQTLCLYPNTLIMFKGNGSG